MRPHGGIELALRRGARDRSRGGGRGRRGARAQHDVRESRRGRRGRPSGGGGEAGTARSPGRLRLADEIHRSYINGSARSARGGPGRGVDRDGAGRNRVRRASSGSSVSGAISFVAKLADRLLQVGRWREAEQLLEEVIDRSPTGVSAGMAYRSLGYLQAELRGIRAAPRARSTGPRSRSAARWDR